MAQSAEPNFYKINPWWKNQIFNIEKKKVVSIESAFIWNALENLREMIAWKKTFLGNHNLEILENIEFFHQPFFGLR